jgi:hypothetical protein
MNLPWDYFWPLLTEGLLVGAIAGRYAFRPRSRRVLALAIGAAVALIVAAAWHGPLGAGDRLAAQIDRDARATLKYYEMDQVSAHVHRGPLTRRVMLSGPADDFQRSELVRTMDTVPGAGSAGWSSTDGGVPLIAEAGIAALLGFLFGLLLAYLIELRRRYNMQWNW